MISPRTFAALVLMASAGAAAAAAPKHETLNIDPPRFEAQRQALEKELASGETYRSIQPDSRMEVLAALDRVEDSLADVTAMEQLDAGRRRAVVEDLQTINTLLAQAAADSRVVCTRERATGTGMAVRTCKTVGERRRDSQSGAA